VKEILWSQISSIERMSVKSYAYIMDDGGDVGDFDMFDDFSKKIVKNPTFERFYELLKEGEDFYLYLVEDFNSKDERFFIRSYLENINLLHPEHTKKVKVYRSYADYLMFELNQYFKDIVKEIISRNTKKIRIHFGIERKQVISHIYELDFIYTQHATLEVELFLTIKEVF